MLMLVPDTVFRAPVASPGPGLCLDARCFSSWLLKYFHYIQLGISILGWSIISITLSDCVLSPMQCGLASGISHRASLGAAPSAPPIRLSCSSNNLGRVSRLCLLLYFLWPDVSQTVFLKLTRSNLNKFVFHNCFLLLSLFKTGSHSVALAVLELSM